MKRSAHILLCLMAIGMVAQAPDRSGPAPAKMNKEEFAKNFILFSFETRVEGGRDTTQSCIVIAKDGSFHRETRDVLDKKAKYGEEGKLSELELKNLREATDDPEFRGYAQDPMQRPAGGILRPGSEIFSVNVSRGEDQLQSLMYFSSPLHDIIPPKARKLMNLLHSFERRKDRSLIKADANECVAAANAKLGGP